MGCTSGIDGAVADQAGRPVDAVRDAVRDGVGGGVTIEGCELVGIGRRKTPATRNRRRTHEWAPIAERAGMDGGRRGRGAHVALTGRGHWLRLQLDPQPWTNWDEDLLVGAHNAIVEVWHFWRP